MPRDIWPFNKRPRIKLLISSLTVCDNVTLYFCLSLYEREWAMWASRGRDGVVACTGH